MADSHPIKPIENGRRRHFLYISTATLGAVGTALAAWPFIDSMNPEHYSLKYDAMMDLTAIPAGRGIVAVSQRLPVFVRHRTPAEIEAARNVKLADLRDPQSDTARVQMPQWIVVIGVCTNNGCIPVGNNNEGGRGDFGGWLCPCCASHYDISGRIRRGIAQKNLPVPPYDFVDERTIGLRSTAKPPEWPS